MSFGIWPVAGTPPVTPTEASRSIQFQFNGVDVGGRNTDTVNIIATGASLVVTIGVGENANVLTVNEVEEEEV